MCKLFLKRIPDTVGIESDAADLLRDSLYVIRMAVSHGNDGVSSIQVQVLLALVVPHPATLCLDRGHVEK